MFAFQIEACTVLANICGLGQELSLIVASFDELHLLLQFTIFIQLASVFWKVRIYGSV